MKLQNRLTIVILAIFISGWIIAGLSAFTLERRNAEQDTIRTARLLLSTAVAARNYTTDQLEPLLDNETTTEFVKQTVPSYTAQEMFKYLGEEYRGYSYREPALNPTNPNDLAEGWQVELIQYFITHPEVLEITDRRIERSGQETLFVAEPIRVDSPSCLECHSTPDVAPASLINTYGRERGFGWQLDEVIAARVISVPTSLPKQQATTSIFSYLLIIGSVFLLAYVTVNVIVRKWLIVPLNRIADMVEEISLRKTVADAQLPETRSDSLGRLSQAINRLLVSLNKALLKK
ncbi:MAG: c-type heme family protein [Thainema sp.]